MICIFMYYILHFMYGKDPQMAYLISYQDIIAWEE